MAVRRERIITLINASFAYRNITLSIQKALSDEARKPRDQQDLAYCAAIIGHQIADIDSIYSAAIETEFYRFKSNESANRSAKERMAKLRESRGAVPRQHVRLPLSTTAELMNPTVEISITTRGVATPEPRMSREEIQNEFNEAYKEAITEGTIQDDTYADYLAEEEASLKQALETHKTPRRGVIGELDDDEEEEC
jgi:hypothetical protein